MACFTKALRSRHSSKLDVDRGLWSLVVPDGHQGGGVFFFRTGKQLIYTLIIGKSPIFTLELSQKFDFQPSTTKPANIGHPTVKTGQIWPLGWF